MAEFRIDGYTVVPAAVDTEAVAAALVSGDRLRAPLRADAHLVPAPLDRGAATDPRLVALAATALGGTVTCFGATYLVKPAHSGLPARWHQDAGPWRDRLGGAPAVTVWVALTAAAPASGCLRVVPGSHLQPTHPMGPDVDRPSMFGVGVDDGVVDEAAAVDLPVAAGDAVALHANLLHASGSNHSGAARVALALRFRLGPA